MALRGHHLRLLALVLVPAALAGCEANKSRNPLTPTVAGPIPGVAITPPKPLEPINGSTVQVAKQPVKLLFENAASNGERPFWHVVEVASDAGFAKKVHTSDKVPPGPNGRATYVLPKLEAGRKYYWRIKAEDGANTGPFSAASSFEVQVPVVLGTPRPVSPVNNAVTSSSSPQFVMSNGSVSGPAGEVRYWVEVARDPGFGNVVKVGSTRRSSGSSTTLVLSLPINTQLYWRAYATAATASSGRSATQAFRTPGASAPPGGGPASWTTEQWRVWFFDLVARKGYSRVTFEALAGTRADLNARGADWQNGWRGDYRPRIFLPVPGCPPPYNSTAPACSYSRPVDVGAWNGPWQWIVR